MPKARAEKSALPKLALHNPLPNPPKQSPQQLLSPATVISPLPLSPAPFVPSDLYISLMSGLAMANMPQTMQAAAAADPMAAFQLAQMCFAPPSSFPLPPFSLVSPKSDPAPAQRHIHIPNLPPKPSFSPTIQPNAKIGITPVLPPAPAPTFQEGNPNTTPSLTSTDTSSTTIEMKDFMLKQIRQARKTSIGWIPEPGFPSRGIFDLIPTIDYVHWSSSDDVTPPDPQRSLVMEDIPCNCRSVEFVRSWADQFPATAIHLNGNAKALIEFPSREVAKAAFDSPRLRGGPFDRATHVRVFWYRPRVGDIVPSPMVTANGNAVVNGEVEAAPDDATSTTIGTTLEEPVPMTIDELSPKTETTEIGKGVQSKKEEKGSSPPSPELNLSDLPVQSPTTLAFTPIRGSRSLVTPIECDQGEQRSQSGSIERDENASWGGSAHGIPRLPVSSSPPVPPMSRVQVSSHLRSPFLEVTQPKRTPSGSPPSLRYPSSTPDMINDKERGSSPSKEISMHDVKSPTSASGPLLVGDYTLEQQLRIKLLAVKGARIANQSCEQSSSSSTPSTVVDHDSDTFFETASPPPVSGTPDSVAISENLELLATSFITDAIQAAQGSPSEQEKLDTVIRSRLRKKRGFGDAFGSSADIAFKRQQLTQQIEESKKIMKQMKAAKTKEERTQIYVLWEKSNRFVALARIDGGLILLCDLFYTLIFRSMELPSKPAAVPFQWPCYAESSLIVDSDDEDDMDLC